MNSVYPRGLLNHLRTISEYVARRGGQANVDAVTYGLHIRIGNTSYDFQPQFLNFDEWGQMQVGLAPAGVEAGFFGWLPYFNRRWPAAAHKLAFKQFAIANGIRTPLYWTEPGRYTDVLIKPDASTFGQGIRGPFKEVEPSVPAQGLREQEYYERFVFGRPFKALYWNGRPVVLDFADMASVAGDGQRTVAELMALAAAQWSGAPHADATRALLAYQGKSLQTRPEAGERVYVDFRYGSRYQPVTLKNLNAIRQADPATLVQLRQAGEASLRAIPEAGRRNVAFSLDGIIDADNTLWFVEANCNPGLHPDIYPAMLDSLFGAQMLDGMQQLPMHARHRQSSGSAVTVP